ncbi:hypothetical protein [Sporosarcina sp. ITBMC105]
MKLNLTLGECSLVYTSLKKELHILREKELTDTAALLRIAEIEELIAKLDTL